MPAATATAEVLTLPKTAAKKASSSARKSVRMPKLRQAELRTLGQFIAALAASFLPVASYVLSHYEAKTQPMMWCLVAAALMFSAPTLAEWAKRWCKSQSKAWGFTILLEGVMVFSTSAWLGYAGLLVLIAINCNSAWQLAGKHLKQQASR